MFAPIAKFIDRSVIEMLTLRMRMAGKPRRRIGEGRLEEALAFLNGPDFIPLESAPARVEFQNGMQGRHFQFPTPLPGGSPENNTVFGRLYRCPGHWQARPAVILLAGGGDFHNHRFGFPWIARRCNRSGFNAATIELPYQFRRRPKQGEVFTQIDYLRMSGILAQAVAEIRALTGWLLAEGCPGVALWGISLGAWLGGMTVCRDARINSMVMIAPPNNLLVRVEQIIRGPAAAQNGQPNRTYEALNKTPLTLTSGRPVIRRENVLLIQGDHDQFVTSGPAEICQGWGHPEIWRLPHGHIGVGSAMVPGLTSRILRWLKPRLEISPAATAGSKPAK